MNTKMQRTATNTIKMRLGLGIILVAGLIAGYYGCGGGGSSGSSAPQVYSTGVLDASFGAGGIVTTTFGANSSYIQSLALQPDGKIVAVGYVYDGLNNSFALARYNAAGVLDPTFGVAGVVTGTLGGAYNEFYSVAVLPGNKILAAGSAGAIPPGFTLFRYTGAGIPDSAFGSGDGVITTTIGTDSGHVYAMAVQADGRIILAGAANNGSYDTFTLARYNANGTIDSSFGSGGITTTDINSRDSFIKALALQPDGRIVAAGYCDAGINFDDFALARYNSNGTLDNTFGAGGITTTGGSSSDRIQALALQPNGKILAGGYSYTGSTYDFTLSRYNSNGTLDSAFGSGGITTTAIGTGNSQIYALALQSDGKILATGYSSNASNGNLCLARYNSDGTLDTTFGAGGIVNTDTSDSEESYALLLQPDNRILIGGYSYNGSYYNFTLARYWR